MKARLQTFATFTTQVKKHTHFQMNTHTRALAHINPNTPHHYWLEHLTYIRIRSVLLTFLSFYFLEYDFFFLTKKYRVLVVLKTIDSISFC